MAKCKFMRLRHIVTFLCAISFVFVVFACKQNDDDDDANDTSNTSSSTTITITYNANGGKITASQTTQTARSGENVSLKTSSELGVSRIGHIFKGWATEADEPASSNSLLTAGTFYKDITLYAVWQEKKYYLNSYTSDEYFIFDEDAKRLSKVQISVILCRLSMCARMNSMKLIPCCI